MNLIESHCQLTVTDEGHGEASIDPDFVERARLHAIKVVPIITHLDQLQRTRIYEVFPDLKGIGESAVGWGGDVVAPCASKPKFTEILGDWLASLGKEQMLISEWDDKGRWFILLLLPFAAYAFRRGIW